MKQHKLRACDRCAAIKQVCDRSEGGDNEEAACSRCLRLELDCRITRIHKPMGRPRKTRALSIDSVPTTAAMATTEVMVRMMVTGGRGSPQSPGVLGRVKRVQRTRSGCITCKTRRKKCDEATPICGDCLRLNLPCQRRSPSPPGMLSLYPQSTPQESHLLQHYIHVVSRSLSVVPDEINTFISLFVPMALQQPALRNALLGLSATHLKRIRPEYDDIAAVSFQQLALQQAQELLYAGNSTEGLAAVLFLCLQEVCEGKSQKWPLHLSAAVTIINTNGGPTSFPPAVRFLIEAVAYFDSVATLSFSKSAFLDQQFYLPTTTASLPAAHPLFGTAHELFATIAEISQLAQLQGIRYHSATAETNFLHLASDLELQLQSWMPTPCPPCSSDPNLPAKITAASVMLQWAALLRLHLIVATPSNGAGCVGDDGDLYHPKIRTAVRNILAAFETIPEGDLVESMLIFPVFAAGFAAVEEEERAYVRRRLGIMELSIGFGNVSDAKEAVERYWEEYPYGSGSGNWEGVVGEWSGGSLIMS